MGTAFNRIKRDAAKLFDAIQATPDGVVWIVGRVQERANSEPEIHLQGVSLDEQTAVAMCVDQTYFVGPLPINVLLSSKPVPWIGLYFPLKPKHDKQSK